MSISPNVILPSGFPLSILCAFLIII
jgi:hypothetical protein